MPRKKSFSVNVCRTIAMVGTMQLCTDVAAQSSVTIGGSLDQGFIYTNNYGGSSRVGAVSNARWPSYLYFSGKEELSSDLQAVFGISTTFRLSDGGFVEDGSLGGLTYVGLHSKSFGKIEMGRLLDPSINLLFNLPAFNNVLAFTPGDADRAGGEYFNSSISYTTPKFGGWEAYTLYSPGNKNGAQIASSPAGRVASIGANYAGPSMMANVLWTSTNGAYITPTLFGMKTFLGQPVVPFAPIRVESRNTLGAGASYFLSPAITLKGGISKVEYKLAGTSSSMFNKAATVVYQISTPTSLTMGFSRSNMGASRYDTLSLFLDYAFSKRTDIYIGAYGQKTRGSNVTATLFTQMPSSSDKQFAVNFGIRTQF
ncbi:porin [Herbaspirillum robiniae]|uniref:porin n=1 Tax=Herbaspirillum robiniae TaxID=2014887 RepID=UPI003D782BEC